VYSVFKRDSASLTDASNSSQSKPADCLILFAAIPEACSHSLTAEIVSSLWGVSTDLAMKGV